MIKDKSHKHTPFQIFQYIGYFLGGLLPVGVFIIFELSGLEQNILRGINESPFIILTLVGFLIAFLTFFIENHYTKKSKLFGSLFLVQALFSFFLIHLLVLYTGGPRSSVFALSYLYIPAVVGYTFGGGLKLWGATALLSISYISNLLFITVQQTYLNNQTVLKHYLKNQEPLSNVGVDVNNDGAWIYIFVFLLQIFVTTIIASRSSFADEDILQTTEILKGEI